MIDLVSTDPTLKNILSRLIPEFKPKKIYLFGSRATGTHRPNSDYDLFLIVEKSELRGIQRMQKAIEVLWDLKISADVFVYTEEEFQEWKDELNSIPHTATNDGVELSFG